jgi:tetratricopeptide (TPR) repeat protein
MEDIQESKWLNSFNSGVSFINIADSLEDAAGALEDPSAGQKDRGRAEQALEESGKAFRNCSVIRPDEFRGWFNYGMTYDRKRDYPRAAELYRTAEDLFHRRALLDSTTNFYDTTQFYQGSGIITPPFAELIDRFKKMKEDQRNRYKGLLTALGGVYFELRQYDNCITVFRRLLGFYEDDLSALEYIGSSYQQLGNQEEALKWTQMILTENPDDKDRLYNVGAHWYNDGVDAKKKYEDLIKEKLGGSRDPNIDAEVTRAKERYERSFTRALEMLERVLQLDPGDKDSWKLKGISLFFLEKTDEAIPVLEKVRQLLPEENKTICQYLRECYRRKGDTETILKLTEECGL